MSKELKQYIIGTLWIAIDIVLFLAFMYLALPHMHP